jgi:Ca2+-binding RTX toxin-like protein
LTVERSAIAGNSGAAYGGGIIIRGGSASIRASTIADNVTTGELTSTWGAGILLTDGGRLALRNSTVTGNIDTSTGYGAGIAIGRLEGDAGRLEIANSIVAGNFSLSPEGERYARDITGAIAESNGHNIFGRFFDILGSEVTGTVPGDLENVGPARLFAALDPDTGGGLLALNGGPTPTVRLRDALGNPALSGADPLDAGTVDQREVDRPLPPATNPDIGSFELDQQQVSRTPSANNDVLTGTGRDDALAALAGNDLVRGLGGGDALRGLAGSDTLEGGPGGDTLDGGTAWDLLRGEAGDDRLLGGPGGDTLLGGGGDDRLLGGRGVDLLRGEAGHDVFDLDPGDAGVGAGRRDLVLDFALDADRIDLRSIDARGGVAGDQAFAFLGTGALTGAGQLRYAFVGTGTVIQASTDADAAPELELQLAGQIALRAGDFLL